MLVNAGMISRDVVKGWPDAPLFEPSAEFNSPQPPGNIGARDPYLPPHHAYQGFPPVPGASGYQYNTSAHYGFGVPPIPNGPTGYPHFPQPIPPHPMPIYPGQNGHSMGSPLGKAGSIKAADAPVDKSNR